MWIAGGFRWVTSFKRVVFRKGVGGSMKLSPLTHLLSTVLQSLSTTTANNFTFVSGTFTSSPQITGAVTTTTFIYKSLSYTRTQSGNSHFALGVIYAKLSNLEEKMRRGLRREIYS